MRSALMASGLAHLVLLVVVFAVRNAAPLIVAGPEAVQVALVDPGMVASLPAPPPAPKAREQKMPEVAPTEEEGVKIAPPRPEKEKKKPEKEKAEEPITDPTPALPYTAVGTAGLRGAVAVDATDFEFTYYLMLVRNRIAQSWSPPAGLATGGRPVRAVVQFRISRGGGVSGARLESGSGVEFFDRSALRAVLISDPLPPLPLGFPGSDLGVHFGFEYGGP